MAWRSFDRLARPYRHLESVFFGRLLQEARTAQLQWLSTARRVLIVGEGDGRFLAQLLQQNANCSVHVVDRSHTMLQLARQRVARHTHRVTFTQADVIDCSFDATYDAIVTLFFLDCFENPEQAQVMARLGAAATPEACWLYSDFQPGPDGWHGLRHRLWLWVLYRAFGTFTDIRAGKWEDPLPTFERLGWQVESDRSFAGELLRACCLRRQPAHAAPPT